ncbi:hypothetical protein [Butyrivibrio sp. LB2008]|nr:hypothetical protein [Butyrivibrio sp. LB2008]
MKKLTSEDLFSINGGDGTEVGRIIGRAARWVYDEVTGVWRLVFGD